RAQVRHQLRLLRAGAAPDAAGRGPGYDVAARAALRERFGASRTRPSTFLCIAENVPLRLASQSRVAATPVPSTTAAAVLGLFIAVLYSAFAPFFAALLVVFRPVLT